MHDQPPESAAELYRADRRYLIFVSKLKLAGKFAVQIRKDGIAYEAGVPHGHRRCAKQRVSRLVRECRWVAGSVHAGIEKDGTVQ